MLVGAAVGDALGWPQELRGGIVGGKKVRQGMEPKANFRAWMRTGGSRFTGTYLDPVAPGEYSDDTQLIIAVSRAYLYGDDWFARFTQIELPTWRIYQRGGGRAVLAAARTWSDGRAPWRPGGGARGREAVERYHQAGGNGAAMRVAPHVLAGADLESSLRAVVADAASTHGHPRAIIGAVVYASTLAFALQTEETIEYGDLIEAGRRGIRSVEWAIDALRHYGIDGLGGAAFEDAWASSCNEVSRALNSIDQALRRGTMANDRVVLESIGAIGPAGGAGTTTAVAAIYLASRGAARPLSGLLAAAFARDADTDTLASMVGGMLGAVHGAHWLGPLNSVQDVNYLRSLAEMLTTRRGGGALWDGTRVAESARQLRTRLPGLHVGDRGRFPDGREFVVDQRGALPDSSFIRLRLALSDGQTVLIDTPIRKSDHVAAAGPQRPLPERARHQSVAVAIRVAFGTGDLSRAARFYSMVLGRELRIQGDEFELSEYILMRRERAGVTPGDEPTLELTSTDLSYTASVLDADITTSPAGPEILARDPDGRKLRIREATTED
ncbi:ADP-ribosylglycohydrolase family protein [Microbacterium sp. LMI1x-1-1.1]|uniref:ADP-ribosylglycohydrolase family protein n=1 Tax=Microbacterium sp. LMI1x-1-1.1 TaxID=3135246 RepID=UPI00341BBC83